MAINRSIIKKMEDQKELERWMIAGGLQSLWTYHKELSFFELLDLVVDFKNLEFNYNDGRFRKDLHAPEKISDEEFMNKLYAKLKEARDEEQNKG